MCPQVRKYIQKDAAGGEGKGKTCNIKGCKAPAVRSLSRQEYETYMHDAGLQLISDKEKKITPCDAHYKALKKHKKKDDKITRVRHDAALPGKGGKQAGFGGWRE